MELSGGTGRVGSNEDQDDTVRILDDQFERSPVIVAGRDGDRNVMLAAEGNNRTEIGDFDHEGNFGRSDGLAKYLRFNSPMARGNFKESIACGKDGAGVALFRFLVWSVSKNLFETQVRIEAITGGKVGNFEMYT